MPRGRESRRRRGRTTCSAAAYRRANRSPSVGGAIRDRPWNGGEQWMRPAEDTGLTERCDQRAHDDMACWAFDAPSDTTIENIRLLPISATARARQMAWVRDISLYHDARLLGGNAPSLLATHRSRVFGIALLRSGNSRSRCSRVPLRAFWSAHPSRASWSINATGPRRADRRVIAPSRSGQRGSGSLTASAPRFTREPTGVLLDQRRSVAGERPVSFAADDRGGGIATVVFVVDGQLLRRATEPTGPELLHASAS